MTRWCLRCWSGSGSSWEQSEKGRQPRRTLRDTKEKQKQNGFAVLSAPSCPLWLTLLSYPSVLLEILNLALVPDSGSPSGKCSQVSPPASLRIFLSGVESIFSGFQLANHERSDARGSDLVYGAGLSGCVGPPS